MRFLFVHQNFPGQYVHVARHLARSGHEMSFITQPRTGEIEGVRKIEYRPAQSVSGSDAYLHELESSVENGLAVARVCHWLDRDGYVPDIVIGHNGWGEILYVKDVWPQTPLLGYFEFFYRSSGSDIDFDAEFPPSPDIAMRLRTRNAVNLLGLDAADWGQTPTRWQYSQYQQRCRDRITIVHEGTDTAVVNPDATARLWLNSGLCLSPQHEIVTYSARDLEPYRGFHVFMRALPKVLRERPEAGGTGRLVDFFDQDSLSDQISAGLAGGNDRLRSAARETVIEQYDLRSYACPLISRCSRPSYRAARCYDD